jgi:hypothetical protein
MNPSTAELVDRRRSRQRRRGHPPAEQLQRDPLGTAGGGAGDQARLVSDRVDPGRASPRWSRSCRSAPRRTTRPRWRRFSTAS